jgi:hypothetical protein
MKREIRDLFYSLMVPQNGYIQYLEGNNNILLTAPHGGNMRPLSIPKRKSGISTMDTYTRRLTSKVYSLFRTEDKPTALIADIHRSKVDLNRGIREAAQGNKKAENIWWDWDKYIRVMQYDLLRRFGNVVYVDIHSHNDGKYFELGYNLNANDYLNLQRRKFTGKTTTMDSLKGNAYDKLFGEYSIKRGLEWFGYDVFSPNGNEGYFNGGRNIEIYSGNGVGAIQIECPISLLKYDLDGVAYCIKDCISTFRDRFAPKISQLI